MKIVKFVSGLLLSCLFSGSLYAAEGLLHKDCRLAFPGSSAREMWGKSAELYEGVLEKYGTDYEGFMQTIRHKLTEKGYVLSDTSEMNPLQGRKDITLSFSCKFNFKNSKDMKVTFSAEIKRVYHREDGSNFDSETLSASDEHKALGHMGNLIKPDYKSVVKAALRQVPNCRVEG